MVQDHPFDLQGRHGLGGAHFPSAFDRLQARVVAVTFALRKLALHGQDRSHQQRLVRRQEFRPSNAVTRRQMVQCDDWACKSGRRNRSSALKATERTSVFDLPPGLVRLIAEGVWPSAAGPSMTASSSTRSSPRTVRDASRRRSRCLPPAAASRPSLGCEQRAGRATSGAVRRTGPDRPGACAGNR